MEFEVFKNGIIWDEGDQCSILFACLCLLIFFDEESALKFRCFFLSCTNSCHLKIIAQCIHCLCPYPIQTNAFLKHLAIKLCPCIYLAYDIDYFPEGDPATVVTNGNLFALHDQLDRFPITHSKLINTIIDHLFYKHINSIVGAASVSQLANVHAGSHANVLLPVE